MPTSQELKIKIFADGANARDMIGAYQNKIADGYTTNPSLLRKSGVTNYEKFAKEVLTVIQDVSISFEVFSDEFSEMERQGRKIYSWGKNVYVKIPITNTKGEFTGPVISALVKDGIPVNITAIFTAEQVKKAAAVLRPDVPSIVSVFAGRIADVGVDPEPILNECAQILKSLPKCELLWASTREAFNIIQAQRSGCHIITGPNDIIKKLSGFGTDLTQVSLDTVRTFYDDATKSGFKL